MAQLTRADRLAVLAQLDDAKVFTVRRATPIVTGALRVSRSTLYGLLAELRASRAKDYTA